MRYPDGGGLTAQGRSRREQIGLEAAKMFAQDAEARQVARSLGEGARLAAATGAWVCSEDESGQALQPPKARAWGRRGRTPVVRVSGRGSARTSVAAMACLKAGQAGRFFYQMAGHRLRPGTRRAMTEADYEAPGQG